MYLGTLFYPNTAMQYIQYSIKQIQQRADYNDSFSFAVMALLATLVVAATTPLLELSAPSP